MQQYSLSEFNDLVKKVIKKNLEPSYWIVAEIGEMSVNQKGHCYLELVEKEENFITAKIRATIWAYTYSNLSNWFENMTGTQLQNGMKVLVNGSLQYHEVFGLSLNIKDIDPNFTIGDRERKKQETIKKLEKEGIIDMNKSVTLPLVPQNIAVISSKTAAGFGDFMHQIDENPYGFKVNAILFKATMQGEAAAESIISALHSIYEQESQFDLVIIIRGGGAQTDLDCFDDYDLCSHLAQFPLPVVTGIGHERDNTIADLVANTKMKTPTAVAEFIINGMANYEGNIIQFYEQIANRSKDIIHIQKERLNELKYSVKLLAQKRLQYNSSIMDKYYDITKQKSKQLLESERSKLSLYEQKIKLSDPSLILNKGFSITTINGKVISKIDAPKKGDLVNTKTKDHTFTSKII